MTIVCDLDGVLADYVAGIAALGLTDITTPQFPQIAASSTFWMDLPPYQETPSVLARLTRKDVDAYFCTKRYGQWPRLQSATWLSAWMPHPSVIVVREDRDKGRIAGMLGAEYVIDDREGAFLALPGSVKGWLIDRPWNQRADVPRRVQRVASVSRALDQMGL